MNRQANVQSIDALERFRLALKDYADVLIDVIAVLQLESQRTVDWVQFDRIPYWTREGRQSGDAVAQARHHLAVKQMPISGAERPPCTEERQALQQARERKRYTEQQTTKVRQLVPALQHQVDEFHATLAKLSHLADTDLPAAIANLERMMEALNRYAIMREPTAGIAPTPTPHSLSTDGTASNESVRDKPSADDSHRSTESTAPGSSSSGEETR